MKALIITAKGVQDQEFLYPYYRLQEAGYDVDVATPDGLSCSGILGLPIEAHLAIDRMLVHQFVHGHERRRYEVLVIPGGVKAMEKLRLHALAPELVAEFYTSGKVVGSICSGAQLLISARIVKGRTISAYQAMRVDVENAGATWHEGPVVVSERIVTAPHYRNLGAWMKALLAEVEAARAWGGGGACAAAA